MIKNNQTKQTVKEFNTYDLAAYLRKVCANPQRSNSFIKETYNLNSKADNPVAVVPINNQFAIVYYPSSQGDPSWGQNMDSLHAAYFEDDKGYFLPGWIINLSNASYVSNLLKQKVNGTIRTEYNIILPSLPNYSVKTVERANKELHKVQEKPLSFYLDRESNSIFIKISLNNDIFSELGKKYYGIYIAQLGAWMFNYDYRMVLANAYKIVEKEYKD